MKRTIAAILAAALLQGCANVSRFEAPTAGTTLAIRGYDRAPMPREMSLDSKSTGQHEFVASTPDGKTLYGILPLNVNGAAIAVSALLFAPALFIGGFRDVFPYYQMDPEAGIIRYRKNEAEGWREFRPTHAESERARRHFEGAPRQ